MGDAMPVKITGKVEILRIEMQFINLKIFYLILKLLLLEGMLDVNLCNLNSVVVDIVFFYITYRNQLCHFGLHFHDVHNR